MSKRTRIHIPCPTTLKRCYHSLRHAKEQASHQRSFRDIPPLKPYKCPDCGYFHLTSQPVFADVSIEHDICDDPEIDFEDEGFTKADV